MRDPSPFPFETLEIHSAEACEMLHFQLFEARDLILDQGFTPQFPWNCR